MCPFDDNGIDTVIRGNFDNATWRPCSGSCTTHDCIPAKNRLKLLFYDTRLGVIKPEDFGDLRADNALGRNLTTHLFKTLTFKLIAGQDRLRFLDANDIGARVNAFRQAFDTQNIVECFIPGNVIDLNRDGAINIVTHQDIDPGNLCHSLSQLSDIHINEVQIDFE